MRVLLDTNVVLWWLTGSAQLSVPARNLLARSDTPSIVSAATAWEICTKVRIGKLPGAAGLSEEFLEIVARYHFEQLPITLEHGQLAGRLPGAHKDPFDRMIAAQALSEGIPVVTNDAEIASFGARILW